MSNEDHKTFSAELTEVFQARAENFLAPDDSQEGEDMPSTGILTGWAMSASWQGDDGQKWITYHRMPEQANWTTRGLLLEHIGDLG